MGLITLFAFGYAACKFWLDEEGDGYSGRLWCSLLYLQNESDSIGAVILYTYVGILNVSKSFCNVYLSLGLRFAMSYALLVMCLFPKHNFCYHQFIY